MGLQGEIDRKWMSRAIELAHRCLPSEDAYSVGAVIVDANDLEIANGYSREGDPKNHAEESTLAKLGRADPRLGAATLYSTLEPCSQRASRPRTCTALILGSGIRRVVIAWREPTLFVAKCVGMELLEYRGVKTVELREMAAAAKEPNAHLFF
jgi:diaminohydroxyphosphoribosylaminopyrimidine deaminase/5-amino-6-(5-phosphoribosylamino)uracil reductase